jgi:SPP1 gp7 family putative phage head morphogenesis protein
VALFSRAQLEAIQRKIRTKRKAKAQQSGPFTPVQRRQIAKRLQARRNVKVLKSRGFDPPRSVEAAYLRGLKRITNQLQNRVNAQLLPLLAGLEPDYVKDSPRAVAWALISRTIDKLAQQAIAEAAQVRIVERMVTSTEGFNRRAFIKDINDAVGVSFQNIITAEGAQGAMTASVAENIDLIQTIPDQYHARLKKFIGRGIRKGDDFFSLRREVLRIGHSSEARARFIARDQVAKLNGKLTQLRQSRVGITHYFWRTSLDERVRETHEAKEGDRFAWANPPADTGHPGQDFQCRCFPEADLSPLLQLT